MTEHLTESADGTPVAYETAGRGAPLVIVNGALCTRQAHAELAALLAERYTVCVYDRRGRGGSGDALEGRVPAKGVADREAEDLAAVVTTVAGPGMRAAVFGMSSGGALALRAASAGLPVTRVAVYEPPFRGADSSDEEHEKDGAALTALLAAGDRDGAVAHFIGGTGAPPEVVERMRRSPEWAAFTALAPTIAYDYDVLGDGLLPTARLAAVDAPVLALAGSASWEFMHDAARGVAEAVPRGRFELLDGQTHEAAPEALAPVLAAFFAG